MDTTCMMLGRECAGKLWVVKYTIEQAVALN